MMLKRTRMTRVVWGAGASVLIWLFCLTPAQAFEIPTGIDNLELTITNTLLYDLGVRLESQDPGILKSPAATYSSDAKFDQWDIMTNRLSLKSKLSLLYRPGVNEYYGLIVSGSAWYDHAYADTDVPVPPGKPGSSYFNNEYSDYTEKWYQGPTAELLAAFLFFHRKFGGIPVSMKVGRTTKVWGPGLLLGPYEISVMQYPFNLRKASAQPGSSVTELFLPQGQVHLTLGLTDDLAISFQYFLEYDPNRLSQGGTYFGAINYLYEGPDRAYFPDTSTPNPNDYRVVLDAGRNAPDSGDVEQYGVMLQWAPFFTTATYGFYFRKFASKQPWLQFGAPKPGYYQMVYATDVKLYGFSINRSVGPVAVAAALSYVQDAALIGSAGPNGGPRGDVMNLSVNGVWVTGPMAFFENASIAAEVGIQHLINVTKNPDYFNGVDYKKGCGWHEGCATESAVQLAINFTPSWYAVFPKINISVPVTTNYTIYGNGATLAAQSYGANQGAFVFSIGVSADYASRYTASLTYSDLWTHKNVNNGVTVGGNGGWMLTDRGRVTLTLKTTF